ncbi:MAG TPA: YojF family protein [Bacillota bacterium]|nr:YojF family protein [Bacillota bacterium]
MEPIQIDEAQKSLDRLMHKDVYVHVETTNGAYASHVNEKAYNVGVYVRNATVRFSQAKIVAGEDSYRIGLKLEKGWIYAEGLTDWEIYEGEKLLFAGHDSEGRLMVALQISETPFDY